MNKKKIRMAVDISMTILLPMLMAYSLIGEKFHEIIGTLMFVLFITHNIHSRGWYKALFKGKYTARRTFQTILNLLLLAFMLLQPVTGILMSKHLYTFIHIPGVTAIARELHMCLAYWGYIMLCMHAGTHLGAPLKKLSKRNVMAWRSVVAVLTLIAVYGSYAFIKRSFAEYMFLRTAFAFFDFSEPRILFFVDYIAVMILFAMIGCLTVSVLSTKTTDPSHDKAVNNGR